MITLLFLEYLDGLSIILQLCYFEDIVSIGILDGEVHSLVLEEPHDVVAALPHRPHDGSELKLPALLVQVRPCLGQQFQSLQIFFL